MSQESFEQFRQLVFADEALQRELRAAPGGDSFLALTVRLGAERGYSFTVEEVAEAMRASRRAWLERWLQ
ncbi:MAG TPA: Nif11-like leader peptide family natural product precursor [Pyrinomonadaceae bacterium]|jgi:predicted ribosomally synthesized peptide with nif11-like leader